MSMHDAWLEKEHYIAIRDDKPEPSDYEPQKKVRIPSYYEEGLYSHQYWEVESDEQRGCSADDRPGERSEEECGDTE